MRAPKRTTSMQRSRRTRTRTKQSQSLPHTRRSPRQWPRNCGASQFHGGATAKAGHRVRPRRTTPNRGPRAATRSASGPRQRASPNPMLRFRLRSTRAGRPLPMRQRSSQRRCRIELRRTRSRTPRQRMRAATARSHRSRSPRRSTQPLRQAHIESRGWNSLRRRAHSPSHLVARTPTHTLPPAPRGRRCQSTKLRPPRHRSVQSPAPRPR